MKKIIILLFIFCLIFPLSIQAAYPEKECPPGSVCLRNPIYDKTFGELVRSVISFFLWLAVALTPLLIIVGAFYLMTAAGDPKKIETGRNIILWTCIGLAVILFSWGIIAFVQGIIGVE